MDGINPSHMDDYWREYEAKRDITGTVVIPHIIYGISYTVYDITFCPVQIEPQIVLYAKAYADGY